MFMSVSLSLSRLALSCALAPVAWLPAHVPSWLFFLEEGEGDLGISHLTLVRFPRIFGGANRAFFLFLGMGPWILMSWCCSSSRKHVPSRRYRFPSFDFLCFPYKSVNMSHVLVFGVDYNGRVQQGVPSFCFLGLGFAGGKEGMIGRWAGI